MFKYAMKGYAGSFEQLSDRIAKFEQLQMTPRIELHLIDLDDITIKKEALIKNCSQFRNCEYQVHFPIQDYGRKYIFDAYNDERQWIETTLDFCVDVQAKTMVTHRCCGYDQKLTKEQAASIFFDQLIDWDAMAKERGVTLLIENYGFVWLPKLFNKDYIVCPLDHFFPWEIKQFNQQLNQHGLRNTKVLVDTAHATLSSNMFNMRKQFPQLGEDLRFSNITDEDLQQQDVLHVSHFVGEDVEHLHVSDAYIWQKQHRIADLYKYLYEENLAIGKGDIDYQLLFRNDTRDLNIVMEINPQDGDYNNNVAQYEAIQKFRKIFTRGERVCV